MMKLLIVEDDQQLQQMFIRILSKHGYSVVGVSNGQLALDALDKDYCSRFSILSARLRSSSAVILIMSRPSLVDTPIEPIIENGEQVLSSEFRDSNNEPVPQIRFVKK